MDISLKNIVKSKFASDSLFNLFSVVLLGICGLILNFAIARVYGAQTLGVFNEVYSFYIIFSQFATLGVQVSSLKHTAEFSADKNQIQKIFTAGFIVITVSAILFSCLFLLSRHWISVFFGSSQVATGIVWIIPGLLCFSMNKLFLNVLNGQRKMKAYALFTAFRYIAMLLVLGFSLWLTLAGEKLTVVFSVSEFLLLAFLIGYNRHLFSFTSSPQILQWIRKHLSFGLKSMVGGVTADMNTRIDVIILGYFTSDKVVGIYSFAATIVEGIAQIPYIMKQNMDPILTRLFYEQRLEDILALIKKGRVWAFGGMFIFGFVLIGFYKPAISLITDNLDFQESWLVFSVLLAGVIIQSSYMPFSGILVQSGFPFLQTVHLIAFSLSNIALNIILVPLFGMFGSAIATSASFVMFVVFLRIITYRALRLRI